MNPVDAALDNICGKRSIGDYYVSIERVFGHGPYHGTIWVSECPGGAYQCIGNFKVSDDFSVVFHLKSIQGILDNRFDYSDVFEFSLYDGRVFDDIEELLRVKAPKYILAFREVHARGFKKWLPKLRDSGFNIAN